MQQAQPFLLQTLAEKGYAITPISQTVKLYQLDLSIKHEENESILIVLSPAVPTVLKHITGIHSASETPTPCTIRYEKVNHERILTIYDQGKIAIMTDAQNASPLLETIGNIARLHYAIDGLMAHASAAAVRIFHLDLCLLLLTPTPRRSAKTSKLSSKKKNALSKYPVPRPTF